MSIIGNPLIIGGGSTAENGVVFITDELDEVEEYISKRTIPASDFIEHPYGYWYCVGDRIDTEEGWINFIEIGATYKVVHNNTEYIMIGTLVDGYPGLYDPNYPFFAITIYYDGAHNYWNLTLLSQPEQSQTIEVYKVGIVRHLTTDPENISTSTDANGGTVVSVKGTEVQLQIKRVTPTSSAQIIEADEGYAALAKVIVEAGSGDILEDPEVYIPETTIAATGWTSTSVGWEYKGDNIEPIEVGATYKVIFNGTEYEVVGINIQGIPALGDSDFSFSTYPFLIGTRFDYNTISWYLYIPDGPSPTEPQIIAVYKERTYGIDPTSPLVGLGQVGSMII